VVIAKQGAGTRDEALDKEQRIQEREQRKKAQRAVEKCEREIDAREAEIARLKGVLEDPTHALNHAVLTETTHAIELEQVELEDLMAEWEKRNAELQALGGE
jgi:hypothetical protein